MAEHGLRARNSIRRRQAIERATLELSLEQGYEDTTIDQIAQRAGIARRSIFDHYPSKEMIVFGVFGDAGDQMQETFASSEEPVIDRVARYFAQGQRDLGHADPLLHLRLSAILQDPALRRLHRGRLDEAEQLIAGELCFEHGLPPEDAGIKIIAGGVISIFLASIEAFVADPTGARAPEVQSRGLRVLRAAAEALGSQ